MINLPKPKDDSSFPGLKPASPEVATKIEYEELQENELMVLEAIYGDDFMKHKDTQSAWKVCMQTLPISQFTIYMG